VVEGVEVNYIIISLMTASLSLFFQKCMEQGMIFYRYFLWLTYWWIKWHRKKDWWKRKFLLALGLCVYCHGTWVAILFFTVKFGLNLDLFLFLGLNFIYIKILKKV